MVRLAWWFLLAAFPAALVLLIRFQEDFGFMMTQQEIDTVWSILLYMLIPCVCCAMGVFLNAAPAVAGELEQRSWIYLATRPRGILNLLLGKYAVAVVWAASCGLVGITFAAVVSEIDLSIFGVDPPALRTSDAGTEMRTAGNGSPMPEPEVPAVERSRGEVLFRLWFTMARLSMLSAMSYGALFLFIGALFPRRAMIFCVFYMGLVEVVLSLIPAIINRLTIQYRLRSLMMNWAEPAGRDQMQDNIFFRYVFAEGSNFEQILWLFGLSSIFLTGAVVAAHVKEFTSASESDV